MYRPRMPRKKKVEAKRNSMHIISDVHPVITTLPAMCKMSATALPATQKVMRQNEIKIMA